MKLFSRTTLSRCSTVHDPYQDKLSFSIFYWRSKLCHIILVSADFTVKTAINIFLLFDKYDLIYGAILTFSLRTHRRKRILKGFQITEVVKKPTQYYNMDTSETVTSPPPLGVGIGGLRYRACENITANLSEFGAFCSNATESTKNFGLEPAPEQESLVMIQKIVSIVVPILFGLIVLVGLFGNALVSLYILCTLYVLLTDNLSTVCYYIMHGHSCKASCTWIFKCLS